MLKSKRKIIFVFAFFTFFIMLFSSSNAMTNLDLKDAVWSNRDSIFESFQNIEKKDVKARSPMYITKTIMEMYAGENGYDDAPDTIYYSMNKGGTTYSGLLSKDKNSSIYDKNRKLWFVFYSGKLFFR